LGRPPQVDAALAKRIVRMSTRDGLSANKIAQRLTERGVPAPGGGAKWYPTTISDVLKRANTNGSAA
jgi:hypothetical protein